MRQEGPVLGANWALPVAPLWLGRLGRGGVGGKQHHQPAGEAKGGPAAPTGAAVSSGEAVLSSNIDVCDLQTAFQKCTLMLFMFH